MALAQDRDRLFEGPTVAALAPAMLLLLVGACAPVSPQQLVLQCWQTTSHGNSITINDGKAIVLPDVAMYIVSDRCKLVVSVKNESAAAITAMEKITPFPPSRLAFEGSFEIDSLEHQGDRVVSANLVAVRPKTILDPVELMPLLENLRGLKPR